MRRYIQYVFALVIFHFLFLVFGFAQVVLPDNIRAVHAIDQISSPGRTPFFYGIPMPPGKIVGDTYLYENWSISKILLYEDNILIEGYPVRLDLFVDELEFNTVEGVKVLKSEKVESFVWVNEKTDKPEYYVNAKEFRTKNSLSHPGFYQVLSDGVIPLLKRVKIIVKKPDYHPILSTGSTDTKILKSVEYYYSKNNEVFRLSSLSKRVIPVFGDKSPEMKKFIDENSLSAADEAELTRIFEHYNALVKN